MFFKAKKTNFGVFRKPGPPSLFQRFFSASLFVDLADVKLAFEDANSKLLNVVSFADVVAEESVDNSLVEILKLRFGRDFKPEIWPRYIDIESDVWSRF